MLLTEGNYSSGSYRFGFNGQEKDDEIYGAGNSMTAKFWQYDARLGRRWNRDPKPNPSISPLSVFANNPVFFSDILGDTVRGTDATSATRMRDEIRNSFKDEDAEALRSLFSLSEDGVTMQSINKEEFIDAIANLSTDQQHLAWAYFDAINSENIHNVTMVKREEQVNSETISAFGFEENETTRNGVFWDNLGGGGLQTFLNSTTGTSYNIIIMDTDEEIRYSDGKGGYSKELFTPGETLAHELLGHSVPQLTSDHEYEHITPVQISNIYRRSQGLSTYRDGTNHAGRTKLDKATANAIPNYIKNIDKHKGTRYAF